VASADLPWVLPGALGSDVSSPPSRRHATGTGAYVDSVGQESVGHGGGDVWVFAGHEPLATLDERHARAKTTEHLCELAADIAPADHDQVFGKFGEIQQRPRREVRDVGEPVDPWQSRPGPGDQKDSVSLQLGLLHPQPAPADKTACGRVEVQGVGLFDRTVGAVTDRGDDLVLARHNRRQIHLGCVGSHTELRGPPDLMGHIGGGDHRLGRDAPAIQAGTA
jgi:hypothetical protein